MLAVSTTLSWPIREGYTLRVDGLTRELAREWDITLVGLCHESTVCPDFPPGVNLVLVPKTDPGFLSTPAEDAALSTVATEIHERERPDALLLWMDVETLRKSRAQNAVIDLIDCTTLDTWRELRRARGFREYARLLAALIGSAARERAIGRGTFATVTVGERDARVLRRLSGRNRIHVVPNGVSVPARARVPRSEEPTVAFTGVMAYPPNVDAVLFFANEVWPAVRAEVPDATFIVAGRDPIPAITELATRPGISVMGAVPDIAAVLERSWLAAAPMRTGAGIKNKVLEAWAVGTPVVMTPVAANGLAAPAWMDALIRTDPMEIAEVVTGLFTDHERRVEIGANSRELARERSWEAVTTPLSALLKSAAQGG